MTILLRKIELKKIKPNLKSELQKEFDKGFDFTKAKKKGIFINLDEEVISSIKSGKKMHKRSTFNIKSMKPIVLNEQKILHENLPEDFLKIDWLSRRPDFKHSTQGI